MEDCQQLKKQKNKENPFWFNESITAWALNT